MKGKKVLKSLVAGMGVLGLVGGLTVVASYTAQAEEATPTQGNLVIHKVEKNNQNGTTPGNGAETTVSGNAIDGVKFKVEKVQEVNLSTNEGWEKAHDVVKASPDASTLPQGYTLGNAVEKVTAGGGLARFENLPLGLYKVTEVEAPQGVQMADPFWVTIPMADPVNTGKFMYDVHAYPKNSKHQLTKAVTNANTLAIGSDLVYSITADISTMPTTSLEIQDNLDKKTKYKSAEVKLGDTVLTPNTDYTVTEKDGLVSMVMSEAGRTKVVEEAKKNALSKLVLNITATVNDSGDIVNKAVEIINGGKVRVESNEVVSKYGAVKVLKQDKETKAGIDGVEFEVWAGNTKDFSKAKKVTVGGKDKFVTANGGKLTIDGLRYSGWADGSEVKDGTEKYLHYWLKETMPAKGYNALVEPIHFLVETPEGSTKEITVLNTKPQPLPMTGARGVAILVASGLSFMAIGGGALVWSKRRRQENS